MAAGLRRGGPDDRGSGDRPRHDAAGRCDAPGTELHRFADLLREVIYDRPSGAFAEHKAQQIALLGERQAVTHECDELSAEHFQVLNIDRLRREIFRPAVGEAISGTARITY